MSYDQWKTRSPDDERHDEYDEPVEETSELELVYDMLDKEKARAAHLRRALDEALSGLRIIRDTDAPSEIKYPDQWRRGMADGVLVYVEARLGSRKA
jgi:hypothetical protein